VVVSRYALIRAGLTAMIETRPDRAVLVDAAMVDGGAAAPDVAVCDLACAANGADSDPLTLFSRLPVVGLTREGQPHLVDRAREAGVTCVVSEHVTPDRLLDALEESVAASPVRRRTTAPALTGRELDVLRLVAAGQTNKQIADRLYVSINTVKTHLKSTYRLIGAESRTQAVLWAVNHGL